MRIGAINWDAALPDNTYFGKYTHNNLGNSEYHNRLPFFAQKTADNEYKIPMRTHKQYDEELRYAAEFGIDFFAYCWYPDSLVPRNIGKEEYGYLAQYYSELNLARKHYQQSEWNKKISMCAIILCVSAYAESDFIALTEAMKQDYYEKIDGRPLVLVFNRYDAETNRTIRKYASAENLNPYIAFISNNGDDFDSKTDYSTADAITAYASTHDAIGFDRLTELTRADNERRLTWNLPVIPLLSMGWNPSPRIARPSPWVTYPNASYADLPDVREIENAFCDLSDFIDKNSNLANTDHVIVFAWNEFEEGGYLCPTLADDGSPNYKLLKNFYDVRKNY